MSRNKGSKNVNPTFMSNVRIKKKAVKAIFMINDFVDASLLNYEVKPLVDYDTLYKALENLNFIVSGSSYRSTN